MVRKKTPTTAIMLIACIIAFMTGVSLGVVIQGQGPEDVLEASELAIESAALEQVLLNEYNPQTCEVLSQRQTRLAQELATIGRELTQEDAAGNLEPEEFEHLKKRYHLMQIRSYLQLQRLSQNCEESKTTILFFYEGASGNQSAVQESLEQGSVLDEMVALLGEDNIAVYAIERDYATELEFIERFYNIRDAPTLIVNFEERFEGFTSNETLLRFTQQ